MAYIVQYIKDFSDIEKVRSVCEKYTKLAYKVKVYTHSENICDLCVENVDVEYSTNPMEQAVLAAHKLYAEKCQLYMERGGIYSVDPYLFPMAEKIKEMDYDEAMELSVNGYNDISQDVILLAKRNSTRLEILSFDDDEPTTIKEVAGMSEKVIQSITKDTDLAVVTLTEIPDKKGVTYHIFKALSDENLYVDSIMLPAANQHQQDISFCIKAEDRQNVERILLENRNKLQFKDIIVKSNIAKISVMGAAIQTQSGIATKLLEVLYESDINVMSIFTSEIKISVILERSHADWAIHEIHKKLIR